MRDGWEESAAAWIASQGERGDYGREFVLDEPMLARVRAQAFRSALDVGCGEGRFCRRLRAAGLATIGVDPTPALLEQARKRDPDGDYRFGRAEALDFPDASFDLVVSYLSLVDVPDLSAGIAEMVRVLQPGGTLLIANLNGFVSASIAEGGGWMNDQRGGEVFGIDHYLDEQPKWFEWRGIRICNWHRPLSTYVALLLSHGLQLTYFDEPAPAGGDPATAERFRRVPHFLIMEWRKPGAV